MFSVSKAFAGLVVLAASLGSACAQIQGFNNANWIWLPGNITNAPAGNASLRRDYYPPEGKTPLSAEILIAADNAYTLWVNGLFIGSQANYAQAYRYCVPLEPGCNVFAVEGQNFASPPPNPAGLVSVIQVRYSDGFTETIVSDADWHAVSGAVPGFQQVAFDDGSWPAAFVQGLYNSLLAIHPAASIPPPTSDPGPNLTSASWIWTNEVSGGNAPIGGRPFRKTVTLPGGQLADSIVMDIVADNAYTLYINGLVVGTGRDYRTAQRYQVNFNPSNTVTIAVYGANVPPGGPAGLLAAGEIRGCGCGCGANAFVVTDATWSYSLTTDPAFINPGFDASNWPAAVVEGAYGIAPWGRIPTPTTNSPQSSAATDLGAPSAPPASVVT